MKVYDHMNNDHETIGGHGIWIHIENEDEVNVLLGELLDGANSLRADICEKGWNKLHRLIGCLDEIERHFYSDNPTFKEYEL